MRMRLRSDLLYYGISKEVDEFDMFYNNIYLKYIYSTVKIVMKWTSILYENLSCVDWSI